MFLSANYGAESATAGLCYNYFFNDYFQMGYYVNGPPTDFSTEGHLAGGAVIDADGLILLYVSAETYPPADTIMKHVNQAN